MTDDRAALVRRGLQLNYVSIAWNVLEAAASLVAGILAGSIALVGFGIDSVIEVAASGAAQWRLRADWDPARRETVERTTRRLVGWSFMALAAYVVLGSAHDLWTRERPERSVFGVVVLALAALAMPVLARAKRRVAAAIRSETLTSEAKQTSLCAYLSAIALVGVGCNTAFGWWWADPIAALGLVPIILREGMEGLRS